MSEKISARVIFASLPEITTLFSLQSPADLVWVVLFFNTTPLYNFYYNYFYYNYFYYNYFYYKR